MSEFLPYFSLYVDGSGDASCVNVVRHFFVAGAHISYDLMVLDHRHDARWQDFASAACNCLRRNGNRDQVIESITSRWMTDSNNNAVLPCLSVRSGFDLFLKVKGYPEGSEVIMTAINIPDMLKVVKHHKLKIVSWDISLETTEPKMELLPYLVTDKTVAIVVAHIYGKWCTMAPIVDFAAEHNWTVIEDCAEAFCGFQNTGHPRSDISLFSFGLIKNATACGGAIAKVRDDGVYKKMQAVYETYPVQTQSEYLKKVLKYYIAFLANDVPFWSRLIMTTGWLFNIDHKAIAVAAVRAFPNGLLTRIKQRPSTPQLQLMQRRFSAFSQSEMTRANIKGSYVSSKLPEAVTHVGRNANLGGYWLYPVVVEDPDIILKVLNALGVDAYRGATQLNLVVPEDVGETSPLYPTEAQFIIDHIVYLPVHRDVPFKVLDKIIKRVRDAVLIAKTYGTVNLNSKL